MRGIAYNAALFIDQLTFQDVRLDSGLTEFRPCPNSAGAVALFGVRKMSPQHHDGADLFALRLEACTCA